MKIQFSKTTKNITQALVASIQKLESTHIFVLLLAIYSSSSFRGSPVSFFHVKTIVDFYCRR